MPVRPAGAGDDLLDDERCHVGNGRRAPGGLVERDEPLVAQELGHRRRLASIPTEAAGRHLVILPRMDRREATFPAALVGVADRVEVLILELLDAEIARWSAVDAMLVEPFDRTAHARRRRRQAVAARVLPLCVHRQRR